MISPGIVLRIQRTIRFQRQLRDLCTASRRNRLGHWAIPTKLGITEKGNYLRKEVGASAPKKQLVIGRKRPKN